MFKYKYLVTKPRFLRLVNGAAEKRVGAFSRHDSVTESHYINNLADHYKWSTIKTLLATLPEPRTMDPRPRTGITGVSLSGLDFIEGVGSRTRVLAVGQVWAR